MTGDLEAVLAIAVLVGSDNLRAGFALGFLPWRRDSLARIAVLFGAAEALMPLIGAGVGASFVLRSGTVTEIVGPAALVTSACLVAVQMRRPAGASREVLTATTWGAPLLLSLDNLAAGVALGTLDFPLVGSVAIVGVISTCLALLGLALGHRLGAALHRRVGIASAALVVLVALGVAAGEVVG